MSDKELLELILKTVREHNLTAYEIGNGTNISTFTVSRIIKGETKKPNRSTLLEILKYLEKNLPGTNLPLDQTKEPDLEYFNIDKVVDFVIENTDELLKNKKFAAWYEGIKLRAENDLLKGLNRK